ncbi:MAG: toluene tolerance family protein [Betaproteobacteria bacterium]|nr:toluene tolerance family protein [Betaproteobacteria bacterium]
MLKQIFRVAVLAAGFFAAGAALAQEAPDALIRKAVDEVTTTIKSDKDIQSGNRQKINVLIDTKIAPYVNFARMTQSAVGRNWAKATPEQQTALTREFKSLLTNTYSGALSSYRPETVIEYRPIRWQQGESDAVVRSVIKGATAEPIQLDYFLEKMDGGWKVVDMNVAGFRLVENYKGQFNSEIANSGIDGLIKKLSALNRANEAKAKS